ncbi:MAG TPA: symmetrical bis(5'-nucleosyl)-tetraphosphatase, partial [Burkholderiales bacterium]|nr:symmetrical bis(5'-nucleosyl)-tetraphosphatase [Burkholderiales bacterium]
AIGDIQGCLDELRLLLEKIGFDARRDRLWFTGDLINRGPKSAETVRFVRDLDDAAVVVLGNHDLYLLMIDAGVGKVHRGDTMQEILQQPDRRELIAWLRSRKLAHYESGHLMVHAGVLPQWDVPKVVALAGEVERALMTDPALFAHMKGGEPSAWDESLGGYDRLRLLINAFTRMRFITPLKKGAGMEFSTKTDVAPNGYIAWYEEPARATRGINLIYGHWASRGLNLAENLSGLDSGCVWGRQLSALRLEDRALFQVECLAGPAGYGPAD